MSAEHILPKHFCILVILKISVASQSCTGNQCGVFGFKSMTNMPQCTISCGYNSVVSLFAIASDGWSNHACGCLL